MAKIGDLRVDMSIDSSGVQKGLKAAQDSISSVSSNISKAVNNSTASSIKAMEEPLSQISKAMQNQMGSVQKQTQNMVEQMNNTFKQLTMPKTLVDPNAFKMGVEWKVASQEILKFIGDLTKAGLITQQTSSRLKAFSFSMLDTGYSVDQIRTGILQTIRAIGEMGTGAKYSETNIRAYAAAMERAAMSTQKLITAGNGFVMLGGGGGNGNDGGNGGDTSFNIDPSGDGRNSLILYRQEMTTLQTVGRTTASSLRSSFRPVWKEFTSKGVAALKKFVTQCDQVAKQGNLISKIWAAAGHIIQGIVISQTFYRGLNQIQNAANALWEFSTAVENSEMALSAMFRDTGKAERLTDVLQEFAANTAFSYEQANAGARKLLAYGIEAKNVLTVMAPLSDAAAASGDSNTFDSIAKAIGQIYTKGKLATQEILQLTEAGIPAYEILQEELGLTKDELADIGRMGISATTAINALLDGMEKRYGGVGEAMQTTMSGMLDKIQDNLLIIGGKMFEPMYEGLKNTVRKMSDTIEKWRETVSKVGFAGLIQSLVSPTVFVQIQTFLAQIKLLKQSLALWWQAISPVVQELAKLALTIANAVLPMINIFVRVLASIAYYITNCTPAVKYLIGILAGFAIAGKVATLLLGLGAAIRNLWICKFVAKAVTLLASSIRILALAMVKSPWIALLAIAAGGLVYLATTSEKVKASLAGLGAKISSVFGVDPSKTFAPENDKNTASAEEFSEALEDTGESMDELRDKANKANKAAKNSLMSFDEVFTLPEELDEETDDLDDALDFGNVEIPEWDVGDLDFGDLEEQGMLSLSQIAKNLVDTFGSTFSNALKGMGLGAIIGAVIGGLIGGPSGALLGAKIGALAGGIVGMFWDSLSQNFKNGTIGAGIGATLGAVVGTIFGGPFGAAIGAVLGGIGGSLIGYFWEKISEYFSTSAGIGAGVGSAAGAICGFALGGPLGAGIGAILGGIAGDLVVRFWDDIKAQFEGSKGVGTMVGVTVGGLIGLCLGGPVGAAVGALLGGIVGNLVGNFWPQITDWASGAWQWMSEKCTAGWEAVAGFFSEGWEKVKTGTATGWENTKTFFSEGWETIKTKTSEGWENTKTFFSTGWETIKTNTSTGWENLKTKASEGWESLKTCASEGWESTKTFFSEGWETIKTNTATGWENLKTNVSEGWESWKTSASEGWENTKTAFASGWESLKTNTSEGWETLKTKASEGWETTKTTFSTGWDNLKTGVSNGWENIKSSWGSGWDNVKNATSTGWENTKTFFSNSWSNIKSSTSTGWENMKSTWSTGWDNLKSNVGTGWENIKTNFSSGWNTLKSNASTGWENLKSSWSSGWSNLASNTSGGWEKVKGVFSSITSYLSTSFSNSWSNVWNSLVTVFKNIMSGLGTAVKAPLNLIIDAINWVIGGLNKISFETPDWVPGVGGKTFGVNIGKIPRLAKGGLVTKNTFAELGEGNKHEAVIPLENGTAIDQISSRIAQGLGPALAREMGAVLAQQTTTGTQAEATSIAYVGTLIADDRGLKELERKLKVIRVKDEKSGRG